MKFILRIKKQSGYIKGLLENNKDAVNEENFRKMNLIAGITVLLMILVIAAVPFSATKLAVLPLYIFYLSIAVLTLLLGYTGPFREHPLAGLYIEVCASLGMGIFLSISHSPTQRATMFLGLLCCIPMFFIDLPIRIDLTILAFFLLHTFMAALIKDPAIAMDDVVNCSVFMILGMVVGNLSMISRLEALDLRRQAEIERVTDILTGVGNRRKLFEKLAELEKPESRKPSGILMIDIDNFKEYNDRFGHAAGDECLTVIGSYFRKTCEKISLEFFRYGGDEFAAIAYDMAKEDLLKKAEEVRAGVTRLLLSSQPVTISVGIAYCDKNVSNYEKMIEKADRALYAAKNKGRNIVCTSDGVHESGTAAAVTA